MTPGFSRLGLTPTDFQAAAVDTIVTRQRDLMAVAATGSGKSEVYLASAVALAPKITVVASPLVALIRDQLRRCERYEIPAVSFHSHMTTRERVAALDQIRDGTALVVVTTPETLRASGARNMREELSRRGVGLLAVDEGHVYEDWSDSFRPAYRWLGKTAGWIGAERVAVLSATLTADAAATAARSLQRHDWEVLSASATRPNLHFAVGAFGWDMYQHLGGLWSGNREAPGGIDVAGKKAILYGRTIRFVTNAAGGPGLGGVLGESAALAYHAELPRKARSAAEQEFVHGKPRILVATTAFGMGVDVPDIRMVAHGQLPPSAIDYLQEAGRAGRDGKESLCLLYADRQAKAASFFIKQTYPELDVVERVDKAISRLVPRGEASVSAAAVAREANVEEPEARSAMGWLDAAGFLTKRPAPRVWIFDVVGAPKERAKSQREFLDQLASAGKRMQPPKDAKARFEIYTRRLDEQVEKWRSRMAGARKAGVVRAQAPAAASILRVHPHDFARDFDPEKLNGARARATARLDEMRAYLEVPAEQRADYLQRAVGLESERLVELLQRQNPDSRVGTVVPGAREPVQQPAGRPTEPARGPKEPRGTPAAPEPPEDVNAVLAMAAYDDGVDDGWVEPGESRPLGEPVGQEVAAQVGETGAVMGESRPPEPEENPFGDPPEQKLTPEEEQAALGAFLREVTGTPDDQPLRAIACSRGRGGCKPLIVPPEQSAQPSRKARPDNGYTGCNSESHAEAGDFDLGGGDDDEDFDLGGETADETSKEDEFDLGGGPDSNPPAAAQGPEAQGRADSARRAPSPRPDLPAEVRAQVRLKELCAEAGRQEPGPSAGGFYMITDCPACGGRNEGWCPPITNKKGEPVPPPAKHLGQTLAISIESVEGKLIPEAEWRGVCVCGHRGPVPQVLYAQGAR